MGKPTHAVIAEGSARLDGERIRVIDALRSSETLSVQSQPRVVDLVERFCRFCQRAFQIDSFSEVSASEAASFIRTSTSGGEPAPATMHLRRSALRMAFRTARELGLAESDPTLDLVLPARSPLKTRALSDEEVALCRGASLQTLTSTRLSAAWALAESSARTGELGHVRVRDLDLAGGRVWLRGGARAHPRWAPLSEWGHLQLNRRLRQVGDGTEQPVLYEGQSGSDYHRQAASCVAIADTIRRAGLADEPDVRPLSVVAWAGRQVFAETGRIDEVARRLGVRSLDRAAGLISFDWTLGAFEEDDER